MFTASHIAIGLLAALIIGLSKTAVPGGGLLASVLFAMVVSGRQIAGTTLPVLLLADVFAVYWYGKSARRDILRPLMIPVMVGFGCGTLFYVRVGAGGRRLDIVLGLTVLFMVALQLTRLLRNTAPTNATPVRTGAVGIFGGFTTFVSNAAGPVLNTYFTGIGLDKQILIGTSAWFYFTVNAAKVPVYLGISTWSGGGAFFTKESLHYDIVLAPAVLLGVFGGRWLLPRIPQRVFTIVVLVLAAIAAAKLLIGK